MQDVPQHQDNNHQRVATTIMKIAMIMIDAEVSPPEAEEEEEEEKRNLHDPASLRAIRKGLSVCLFV